MPIRLKLKSGWWPLRYEPSPYTASILWTMAFDCICEVKTDVNSPVQKQEEIRSGLWKRVRGFATQAKLLPPPTPEELTQEEETFYPAE